MLTPVQDALTNPTLMLPDGSGIEFRDGQLNYIWTNEAGAQSDRLISWESARQAFTGVPVDTGWLPPEVVRAGLNMGVEWCVAFLPPGRHELEITVGTPGKDERAEKFLCPLPGLALVGMQTDYHLFALKTDRFDPHYQLEVFRTPLPNVMENGILCPGLLKLPRCTPRTILKAWEMFRGNTFNNHAASGKSKSNPEDVRVVLRELAAQGESARYPLADLERYSEQGMTLDKLIRTYFETGEMPL